MSGDVADLTVGPPGEPEVDDLGPELGPEELEPGVALEAGGEHVDPATVSTILEVVTNAIHALAGDPDVPDHWRATDDELEDASAALARIANRSPVIRRAAGGSKGDAVALVVVGGTYVIRNASEGRAAQAAREEQEEQHREHDGQPQAFGPAPSSPYPRR